MKNDNYHVVVFDLVSGKERCRMPIDGGHPRSFALSPDGLRVASTTGLTGRVWDAATGKVLWDAPDIGFEVTALAFSEDGNRLVTALSNATFLIWDMSSSNGSRKN